MVAVTTIEGWDFSWKNSALHADGGSRATGGRAHGCGWRLIAYGLLSQFLYIHICYSKHIINESNLKMPVQILHAHAF